MKNRKRESISSIGSADEKKRRRRRRKLQADICAQVEFYFSDPNLRKDRFLSQEIKKSSDGYVPLEMVASFNKIRSLTEDYRLISKALHKSELLEVSPCGTKLRRKKPLEEPKYSPDDCTVYVECLPKTADIEWIQKTFRYCGNVVYVSLPRYQTTRDIKGFAFVEYETPEEAARACQLLNNPLDDYGPPGRFPKTRKGKYFSFGQPATAGQSEQAKGNHNGIADGSKHNKHDHDRHEHRHGKTHHHHRRDDKKGADEGGEVIQQENLGSKKELVPSGKETEIDGKPGTKKKRKRKQDQDEGVDAREVDRKGEKKRKRGAEDLNGAVKGSKNEKQEKGQETEKVEVRKRRRETVVDVQKEADNSARDKVSSEGVKEHDGTLPMKENHGEHGVVRGEEKGEKEKQDVKETVDKEEKAVDEREAPKESEKCLIGEDISSDGKSKEGDMVGGEEGMDSKKEDSKDTRKEKSKGDSADGSIDGGNVEEGVHGKDLQSSKRKHSERTAGKSGSKDDETEQDDDGKVHSKKRKMSAKGNIGEEKGLEDKKDKSHKTSKHSGHQKVAQKRKMSNDENQRDGDALESGKDKSHKKAKQAKEPIGETENGDKQDAKAAVADEIKIALKEIRNAVGGGEEESKKKKRVRQRKEKEEPQLFLRVLSKAEWLKLKEQYLHLQKIGLQEMKAAMRAQWRGIVSNSQKNDNKQDDGKSSEKAPIKQEPPKLNTIEFVEGVVVSIKAKEPVSSRKTLREQLEGVAPVAYVDLQDGDSAGFVRFKTRRAAETVVSHKFEALAGISFELIKGEEEKAYWDKLRTDQENKLNSTANRRKKKRGRQRIMAHALKASGPTSHTRFDDDS